MVKKALTPEERLRSFRDALGARDKSRTWHELARAIDDAMREGSAVGYGEDVLKRLAMEATGLTWGILTRYLTTLRRVKMAAEASGLAPEVLLAPGFNAVETAVRLYERSPAQGLEVLKGLATGSMTTRDMRRMLMDEYDGERPDAASRSRTLRRRGVAMDAVEKSLKRNAVTLFPKDSLIQKRPPLRHFRRYGIEVRRSDGSCACGLDAFVSEGDDALDDLDAALPSVFLMSLYFPRHYIVLAPGSPPQVADRAVSAVDLFGYRSIGVLKVHLDLSVETLRKPSGRPNPDRVADYEALRAKLAMPGRR